MSLKLKAILLGMLIVGLIAGATGLSLWIEYNETKQLRETMMRDVTNVVSMHMQDTVTQVDGLLAEIGGQIVNDGGAGRMNEVRRWQQLGALCRSITACTFIGVSDAEGRTVAISSVEGRPDIDVSDRDFFRVPKASGKLFIDKAIVTRVKGNPIVFNISRPVFDKDGKLLAVVAAGLNAGHFASFYRLMGFTLNPTIAIFKGNGDVVARNPGIEKYVGRNIAQGRLFRSQLKQAPAGVFEALSELDGETRVAAYRTLPEFDLVVFAGIEKRAAFAVWRSSALRDVVIIGASILCMLLVMRYAYGALRREAKLEVENQRLDQLSHMDGLTGIANRRAFDNAIERDWEHYRRQRGPLSVLMIDVDFFKLYNDHYGHQAGDDCLRAIAHALQLCVKRDIDVVARYGGEEFGVLLNADEKGALKVARLMRAAVEAQQIAHAASTVCPFVTVSIGVACADSVQPHSADELVACADEALYQAKSEGRNRVCVCRRAPVETDLNAAANG
jgi:diguanylate cyclase (GGDEF)-like protein